MGSKKKIDDYLESLNKRVREWLDWRYNVKTKSGHSDPDAERLFALTEAQEPPAPPPDMPPELELYYLLEQNPRMTLLGEQSILLTPMMHLYEMNVCRQAVKEYQSQYEKTSLEKFLNT